MHSGKRTSLTSKFKQGNSRVRECQRSKEVISRSSPGRIRRRDSEHIKLAMKSSEIGKKSKTDIRACLQDMKMERSYQNVIMILYIHYSNIMGTMKRCQISTILLLVNILMVVHVSSLPDMMGQEKNLGFISV